MKHRSSLKITASLLVLILLSAMFFTLSPGAADSKAISFGCPAIPCDKGETVKLTDYGVCFEVGKSVSAGNIAWYNASSSEKITSFTPSDAGVYTLTAKSGTLLKSVFIVAKNPTDTEYVLYSENFTAFDVTAYKTIQQTSGANISASDGKLLLDAANDGSAYIRVKLPDFLDSFGDYNLESSVCMTKSTAASRWMSLMFRIQGDNYPYYQMAIRQDSTLANGTELAERTAADAWNVTNKVPYTEAMSADKYYTMAVRANGINAKTYIDGKALVDADNIGGYTVGGVGFQVRGCAMSIDSVKITIDKSMAVFAEKVYNYVQTNERDINIIKRPAVIASPKSGNDFNNVLKSNPDAVILYTDENLNVTFPEGESKTTIETALQTLDKKAIPIFGIETVGQAEALAAYMKTSGIIDYSVMSSQPSVLNVFKNTCRTILSCDKTTQISSAENAAQVRKTANECNARSVMINGNPSREFVHELQNLLVTVFINPTDLSVSGTLRAINTGCDGIVIIDVGEFDTICNKYYSENSLLASPEIIAHRGTPTLGQENSVSGSLLAYEHGANLIENDIQLSKDGVIVVMHDATIDRTTNGTGKVAELTYAQLSKFVIDVNTAAEPAPIPTLEDYFKAFKGIDAKIVVEIKSQDPRLAEPFVNLVKQYDMASQINVISFYTPQIERIQKLMPELSYGYLTSSITFSEAEYLTSLEKALDFCMKYRTTFNPSYLGGTLGPNFINAASIRGVSVLPWTVNDNSLLDRYMLYGTDAVTTNNVHFVSDYVKYISAENTEYAIALSTGASVPLPVTKTTYDRKTTSADAELVLIEGNKTLKYANGVLSAFDAGNATIMFRYTAKNASGTEYNLYSEVITINVSDSDSVTASNGQTTVQSPDTTNPEAPTDTTATDSSNNGCSSNCKGASASAVIFIAAALIMTALVPSKKTI